MKGDSKGTVKVCLSVKVQVGHPLQRNVTFVWFDLRLVTICVFAFKSPLLLQCLHYSMCAGVCVWGRKILNRKALKKPLQLSRWKVKET